MPRTGWKKAHPEEWARMQRLYRGRTGSGVHGRRRWTAYEDQLVREQGHTSAELSLILGRSQQAIYARRSKLRTS